MADDEDPDSWRETDSDLEDEEDIEGPGVSGTSGPNSSYVFCTPAVNPQLTDSQGVIGLKLEAAMHLCFCAPARGERESSYEFLVGAIPIYISADGGHCSRSCTQER